MWITDYWKNGTHSSSFLVLTHLKYTQNKLPTTSNRKRTGKGDTELQAGEKKILYKFKFVCVSFCVLPLANTLHDDKVNPVISNRSLYNPLTPLLSENLFLLQLKKKERSKQQKWFKLMGIHCINRRSCASPPGCVSSSKHIMTSRERDDYTLYRGGEKF